MVTQLQGLPNPFVLLREVSEWLLSRGSTSPTFVSRIIADRGQCYDGFSLML